MIYYTDKSKEIKRFTSEFKPVNQRFNSQPVEGDLLNIKYVKNKIMPREVLAKAIFKFTSKHTIMIKVDYSFDFAFDVDRDRWYNLITTNPTSANKLAFEELYKEAHIKETIWRDLRDRGYFSPIVHAEQDKFFDFLEKTIKIKTITIPWNMHFKQAFQIELFMEFDVPKFVRTNLKSNRNYMRLYFFPKIEFKIANIGVLPNIFLRDGRYKAQALFDPFINEFMVKDKEIIQYIYKKTSIRLDKGIQFKVFYDYKTGKIEFEYQNLFNFIYHVIRGRFDLLGGYTSTAFVSQKLELHKSQMALRTHNSDFSILMAIALYGTHASFLANKYNIKRKLTLKEYVNLVKKEIKKGTLLSFLTTKR